MATAIKTIYAKFNKGHALTTAELKAGIHHFGLLYNTLMVSGPEFKLAANEAFRVYDALTTFLNRRGVQL